MKAVEHRGAECTVYPLVLLLRITRHSRPSLRKSSSIVPGQWRDDETHSLSVSRLLVPFSVRRRRERKRERESRWPFSSSLSFTKKSPSPVAREDAYAWAFARERHDSSRESGCRTFLFLPLFLLPFSASLELLSFVRVIKQLKSAFAIRRKKQRRVSVFSRLFYRGALRYTWDLAAFPSFSSENR